MKQAALFVFLMTGIIAMVQAQTNTFPNSGNVGIGTTNPHHKLEIRRDIANGIGPVLLLRNNQYSNSKSAGSAIKFLGSGSPAMQDRYMSIEGIMRGNSMPGHMAFKFNKDGNIVTPLTIKHNNRIGIGTNNPLYELEIRKDAANSIGPTLLLRNNQYSNSKGAGSAIKFLGSGSPAMQDRYMSIEGTMRGNSMPGHMAFKFNKDGNIVTPLVIKHNGRIGIGTDTPDVRLTVNGTTKAKEVIVEENVGADFVFEEDYTLPDLFELESFIQANKRLPEVPSAEDMGKNGVKVGKLQMKLLQKIEELTLYVIGQKKTEELLKKELDTQSQLIEALTKRIKRLEKQQD